MDGFVFVDKPKGLTSQDVCLRLKRKFNSKCGHNGTLDPNTTGVLVVAVGKACKLLKLINEHDKEYEAKIVFGYDSTTLDVDGEITKNIEMNINLDELKNALSTLALRDEQVPPMTSAIKVNGRKLYEYQRKGIEVEVKPRKTKIHSYKLLSDLKMVDGHYEIDILLDVAKGFYVRSFARDLGNLLGGCAILKELRRTKAGEFNINECKMLDKITEDDLKSIKDVFNFKSVEVDDYIAKLVKNGVVLDQRQTNLNEVFFVTNNCDIIAIYEPVGENKYKPIIIF